jgi:uncharacterized protein (TIGR03435 family)
MRTIRSGFKCFVLGVAICELLIPSPNAAQRAAPAPKESFDALSIKQIYSHTESLGGSSLTFAPKTFECQYQPDRLRCGLSIRSMVEEAYQLDDIEVDIPKFTYDSDHCFVIEATMPPGTTKETARLMLQQALAERFGLKAHWEKRDTPVYALVPGKNGIKIQPDADPDHPKLRPSTTPTGKTIGTSMQGGPGEYFAAGTTLDLFAKNLRYRAGLDRPVVDKTGLAGVYTFDLKWLPTDPPNYVDPAIIMAVEVKLGLRLEKRVLPFNVLVVDHIEEMPTAN